MIFLSEFIKKHYFAFVGFLVGIANGLFGSGGGMIAVPMLEKSGMEAKKAHATSIAVTAALSAVSLFVYFSRGAFDLKTALKFVPPGLIGAAAGAAILKKIDNEKLQRIFGAVMIISGILMITRSLK